MVSVRVYVLSSKSSDVLSYVSIWLSFKDIRCTYSCDDEASDTMDECERDSEGAFVSISLKNRILKTIQI